MTSESGIQLFLDQIERILTFWARPLVRNQLLAIVLALVATIIVERLLTVLIRRWLGRQENRTRLTRIGNFSLHLLFPIVGLIMLSTVILVFDALGLLTGLIKTVRGLFWFILYYRIALAIVYDLLDSPQWRRIHYRLVAPVFWIFLVGDGLSHFINWRRLAEFVLGGAADNPLTLGTLAIAVAALYLWINSVIHFHELAHGVIVRRTNARPGAVEGGLTVVRYLFLLVGVYLFLLSLGLNSTTIAAITGGLSVGIGFGLQSVISNFVSGIILLLEGSIQPGDILTFNNDRADVKKLGIRSTIVSTDDQTEIIIPNSELFTSQVVQRTGADDYIRTLIRVRARYTDDPAKVIEVLETTANDHPKTLGESFAPRASIEKFGDFAVHYRLQVWSDHRVMGPVGMRASMHWDIYHAFKQHGIEMPYPHHNVHLDVRRNSAS